MENFGMIPGDYAESVGWLGEDVWHAHCVQLIEIKAVNTLNEQ